MAKRLVSGKIFSRIAEFSKSKLLFKSKLFYSRNQRKNLNKAKKLPDFVKTCKNWQILAKNAKKITKKPLVSLVKCSKSTAETHLAFHFRFMRKK